MSTNQFIVRGEAAESDSDDEVNLYFEYIYGNHYLIMNEFQQLSEKKPASIIDGEASESDDGMYCARC